MVIYLSTRPITTYSFYCSVCQNILLMFHIFTLMDCNILLAFVIVMLLMPVGILKPHCTQSGTLSPLTEW